MDRLLTEKIKAHFLRSGMDLVGIAPVDRWTDAPFLMTPKAILPSARNVIVSAIHITDTWTEMGGEPTPQDRSPGGWMDQNGMMDHFAFRAMRILENEGYEAIGIASSNIWRYRSFPGLGKSNFAPDLSHIYASVAAGLTQMGWHGLAITPEFGPRIRFITVVTNADLVPTPMYEGDKLCDMCFECVRHCPSAALRKDFLSDRPVITHIGGKEFRFADKNLWRCAWAEHFNLDLSSDTLEKDHVDESVILNEIASRGELGHERGVCQKVCIPPHLRSEEPSFGREDKKLTMKRINKRYPDNMPTLRKLRDDFIARAMSLGAELVNVGPIDRESKAFRAVELEAPGMQTAIGMAFRVPEETLAMMRSPNSYVSGAYSFPTYMKMHMIGLVMCRWLEDMGYHASLYTHHMDRAGSDWFHADFLLPLDETAEQLCAQVRLGRSTEAGFEVPEFPACQVAAIATDAPLDAYVPEGTAAETKRVLSPAAMRKKLERIADDALVTAMGIAPAERVDRIYDAVKPFVNEKDLSTGVKDVSGTYHGDFVPALFDDGNRLAKSTDYLENARSVIVLTMDTPECLVRNSGNEDTKQIGTYAYYSFQAAYELRYAALEIATELGRMGCKTVIAENLLGLGSKTDTPRGTLPDMRCNALEAAAAGLGSIGKNGALMTRDHGSQQRQIAVITDAVLPYDAVDTSFDPCAGCAVCTDVCPMQALNGKEISVELEPGQTVRFPLVSRIACDWSKRYDLCAGEGPALIGNQTNVPRPEEKDLTWESLCEACKKKDPVMKRRTAILESCLRYCPVGEKK